MGGEAEKTEEKQQKSKLKNKQKIQCRQENNFQAAFFML
jgi:hypothetical protein